MWNWSYKEALKRTLFAHPMALLAFCILLLLLIRAKNTNSADKKEQAETSANNSQKNEQNGEKESTIVWNSIIPIYHGPQPERLALAQPPVVNADQPLLPVLTQSTDYHEVTTNDTHIVKGEVKDVPYWEKYNARKTDTIYSEREPLYVAIVNNGRKLGNIVWNRLWLHYIEPVPQTVNVTPPVQQKNRVNRKAWLAFVTIFVALTICTAALCSVLSFNTQTNTVAVATHTPTPTETQSNGLAGAMGIGNPNMCEEYNVQQLTDELQVTAKAPHLKKWNTAGIPVAACGYEITSQEAIYMPEVYEYQVGIFTQRGTVKASDGYTYPHFEAEFGIHKWLLSQREPNESVFLLFTGKGLQADNQTLDEIVRQVAKEHPLWYITPKYPA